MNARLALCLEEEACKNPQIVGLQGERLDAQSWLDVYTSGEEARKGVNGREAVDEFWVLSCSDVEPINLAASLKADRPEMKVCLVATERCGSLLSRAHTADIDEVIDFGAFPGRYGEAKKLMGGEACQSEPASADAAGELQSMQDEARPSGGRKRMGVDVQAESSGRKGAAREPGTAAHASPASENRGGGAPFRSDEVIGTAAIQVGQTADEDASATRVMVAAEPLLVASPEDNLIQLRSAVGVTATDARAFVLSVVSGSGGAGKSAVSALSALAMSRAGHKTLLLDCDLQFGDVASMVGADRALCIDEALQHPDRLEVEVWQPSGLAVLAAPDRLETSEEVVRQLPSLLEWATKTFDAVVVNTGALWAEQHALLLESSSAALFLVDQRVSSVRACKHALELCARCGIASSPFQYALNRCAKGAPLSTLDVSSALQGASVFELKDGGRDVEDYLSSGAAAELIGAHNEFAKSVVRVVDRFLPGGLGVQGDLSSTLEDRRQPRKRTRFGAGKRGRGRK